VLADLLPEALEEPVREVVRSLLAEGAARRKDDLLRRIPDNHPVAVRDLLLVIAAAAPEVAAEAARQVTDREDEGVQLAMAAALGAAPEQPGNLELRLSLLSSTAEAVRVEVVHQLASSGDAAAFDALAEQVKRRAVDLTRREADALGRGLARLSADRAYALFEVWARPKNLLKRFVGLAGQEMYQWTSVAGMESLPEPGCDDLIAWVAERAGKELHDHCMRTLARRKRAAGA
jgi:hypothetical protein